MENKRSPRPVYSEASKEFTPKEERQFNVKGNIKGFIASVEKPRYLKIITTDERVGVDLFVNGRLRKETF